MKVTVTHLGPSTSQARDITAAELQAWLQEVPAKAIITIASNAGSTYKAEWGEER